MDLPATQAMGEDELPATQQFAINEDQEKTLVGTLLINKKTYSIFSGLTKIGRHPECQIVLDYETVSKKHAEIEAESPNKTVFIRDLNSSNQTRINKSKIRPNSLYQIKDGDELIFGNVIASFKLYQPIDDSLVSCTPQVHRKLKAIIPGTPDSSMNTSSASEGDTSIIPGTQMDKTDPNFRLPEIPVRSSKSDEHRSPKVPAFTLDDLPSPLNKEKSRQDDICEAETQRFSTSDTKENYDNTDNIYTAATQKASSVTKAVNADDNIYDMATQRPTDSDEETNELENLTTQRPDYKYPESSKVTDNHQSINDLETQIFNSSDKKSLEVSIYSAATQKNVPETLLNNESIEDLETQQFNLPKMDIDSRKSNDVSIYSAATQKNDYDKSNSKSIEDLETQAFDTRKSNVSNQKSNDVSIYSAETQKNVHDESVESIENLETQQFDKRTSNTSNNSSHDVSIHSAVTQKNVSEDFSKSIENLETQPFDTQKTALKRTSHDLSIYSAATQKVNNDTPHESIENIETQNFDINKPEKFVAPSPLRRKCNKSLYDAETQRCVPNESISESIEHMETQQFRTNTTDTSKAPITNKVPNKYIYADDTQKRGSADLKNKSIDNLETQQFVNIANEIIDDSTESLHLVDESPQMISSLSFTSQNESRIDTKHTKESSFDSGIQRTEQENDQNDISEDQNNYDMQFKKPLVNKSKKINDKEDDASKSIQNIEEGKSILEGENEEEMFSQNLIEDCPFAFLPEESTSNENQSITSKVEENNEFNENQIINDSIFNSSTNIEIHKSKATASKPHNIINESDSETDEEGVFTNHSSNEDKSNQSSSKYNSETEKGAVHKEADSETDEEGVFSNHLSNQSEGDNKSNKQDSHENSENDSETDEEGVFSDRMVKEKKNKSKKGNDVDSDEDIFDNILEVEEKTKLHNSNILPSKSNNSICKKSPTRDSQDLMLHDNYETKINSIQKSQTTNTHSSADKEINGIEIEDVAPIQEAGNSFKAEGASKTTQSRMSSLTIIRTKRSVDADDAQNQPSKRSKTTAVDENHPKLQQLSPAPVTATELDKKRVTKMPTTLDSFVIMPNSRNRTDSSDLSAIENSVIEETQNEKSDRSQTTRGRAAAANRKKTKVEVLSVHSNNSSKENLVVENSDVESVPNTSKARNTRLKRNLNITESSVIKNSSKDEISNSSVDSDSKRKTRGRATRQKKDVPPKEPVETKKVATIIQDSDAEGSDESEFVKESKNKSAKTIQSSYSEKSSNSIVVKAKSQNQKENVVEQTISGKSDKLDVNLTVDTKSMRTRRVKESDTEKSDSSMNAANKKTNARTRRGMKVENSSLEESSSSDNAATKANTNNRNKNVKELDSETSDTDISKRSRSTRIKQSGAIKIKPKFEESHKNDLILDSNSEKTDTLIRASRSRRAEKSNVTLDKETRSRRANTRNQSSDSVFSETDTDKDKNSSLTSKSNGSRPVRQTRKRKVPTNVSTVDTTSSEESQEIAEIMKNSSEKDANKSQKRKTQRAKNTPSNSEDTQDSESNNTHVDDVFEKPVSRPKRARLVKSNRNKSLTKNNLVSDKEVRTRSPQQFSTPQKKTPSPDLPPTPSRLTPSRNRKTMSMSPMKGASYKVLFTGERSEVHRKIVAKLGGSEMEDPEKCSILVTDKVRRTYKFLCCLAQGIPIVSVDWLNDSGKAQRFLNWENYVLQDPTAEAKFKFKLKNSLEKASNHRLLEGYTVLITPRITQPPVAELKGMVISSGGKPLVKPPTKWQENTVIITKDEDLQNAKKFAAKAPKSVTVHSTEFILTGILRQELSLEEFKLTV